MDEDKRDGWVNEEEKRWIEKNVLRERRQLDGEKGDMDVERR